MALVYSTAGMGGGSSYIALLALFNYPHSSIPVIALLCNIIVVSGGSLNFYRQNHFRWELFWPFAVFSVPMAFVGGLIPLERDIFFLILGASLLAVAIRLLFVNDGIKPDRELKLPNRYIALLTGTVLGLLAGMTGIGGGIFLAPVLLYLGWALPKQVAATAAFFILLNSLSGLGGQLLKHSGGLDIHSYWPLFLTVLIGGQIGSRVGSNSLLSQNTIRKITALLVLFVALRIIWGLVRQ